METLNGIRGDEKVDLFWTKVTSKAGAVDVGEPALPRRRKAPIRFDDNAVRRRLPGNNFDREHIRVQLQLLDANFDVVTIWSDGYLSRERVLSVTQPGTAVALLHFILVIPATNATSERLFTVLRHLKSYLRTTTLQERLNYLMLLHVHKE